jgi:sugar phosphate isomerase/epimerase
MKRDKGSGVMKKPVVGAQLYTVRKFTQTIAGIEDTLKKVSDLGYTTVQLSGHGQVDPGKLAKVIERSGLKVAATHIGWHRLLDDLDAVIEEHRMLRCEHPAIGSLPAEYLCEEGINKFADEVKGVAERLAAAGMDFSYHNHNRELARCSDGKTWLETLYDTIDPRHLKAEIDTYWIQAGGGDPAEWVRRCSGREPLLHLKDMLITLDGQVRMAEVGEGNLNWAQILEAADEGGVEHLLVEQDDTYERDPFESLGISYRNLRKMGYE